MRRYIAHRVLLMIPVLILVTLITFAVLRVAPGDAVNLLFEDSNSTQQEIDEFREQLGLDRPIAVQYGMWLWDLVRLDMGKSFWTDESVVSMAMERLPVTLELALLGLVLQLMIALPVGIYSATHQDKLGDQLARFIVILGVAAPNFWIATLVIVFLAAWLNWLPPLGYIPSFWSDPWLNLQVFFLPSIVLGFSGSASLARYTRNTLLEVVRQDYIRTAFAKGMSSRRVWNIHALRNAMIPVVTIMGAHMASLMGGTVIIENIFALPGLGQLTLQAILNRDLPVLQFNVFFLATIFVVINLLVDISYSIIDPRIKYK